MANPHINYATFKSRFGDLGITEWTKYNYLSNYNFGLPAQTEVPTDKYLELEYIQSTGTQYIVTNYFLKTNNIAVDTKVSVSNMPTDENDIIGNQSGEQGRFVIGLFSRFVFGYSRFDTTTETNVRSDTFTGATTLNINAKYDSNTHIKSLTVNGNTTSAEYNVSIINNIQPITLFAQATPSLAQFFTGNTYYLRLYDNGQLALDLHPVKRLSDGAIGMYDTVSGQFFGNAGTGTFTSGPMKQRYVRVEYVQFNRNDAIQTGLVSRLANYIYDADIQFLNLDTQFTGNSTGVYFGIGDGIFGQTANPVAMNPSLIADTQRHHFVSQIDTGSQYNYLYVDDVKSRSSRPGAYDPSDICIGAVNSSVAWPCYMKVYRYAIYENGILLRNFVPVYDLVTAKYGLFDLVSGTFYGSVTGSLTGPWTVKKLGTQVWSKSTGYPGGFWSNQTNAYTWSRGNEAWIVDLTHKYHTAILGLGDVYGPDKTVGATVPELEYQEFRFMDKDLIDSPIGNALEYTWIFLK